MNNNIISLKIKNNESLILDINEPRRLLCFYNNYYKKLNILVKFKTLINKNKFSYTYFFIYFFFINKIPIFWYKIYKKTFVIFYKEFLYYFFTFLTRWIDKRIMYIFRYICYYILNNINILA